MSKDKHSEDVTPIGRAKHAAVPDPVTGCVVCGQNTGEFAGHAGAARWHQFCEDARPDVIAKVKARA